MFDFFSGKKNRQNRFRLSAANLQNINFIHSQPFVQLLFGYVLNNNLLQ